MRVLITGGAGFVGSFTAARFAREGHQVTGFDRVARPLDPRHGVPGLPMIEGDIVDRARILEAVDQAGAEAIVHTAAIIGQENGAADPLGMFRINVEGTLAVLEAVRARGLRLVYVSTATLYGMHPDLHPLTEDARPEPVGMYDTTKLMAETLVVSYHKIYGLDTLAVRPGYVYGPNNSTGGYFLESAFRGESIIQPIGADLPMDLTYVRDLADGIYRATTVRPITSRIFNITGGVLRLRGDVAALVRRLVPGTQIEIGPGIPTHAHLRGPSVLTRAQNELGYRPQYSLEAGMTDWLTWLRTPAV